MKFRDYYEVLGVERTASADEIKRAYRKKARECHPDLNQCTDGGESFKELSEAHEVLKDPEKRKRYDQLGANWKNGQDFTPPPGWGSRAGGGGGGQEFYFHGGPGMGGGGGFSDFFETIFGRGGAGGFSGASGMGGMGGGFSMNRDGSDATANITISLGEAFNGASKSIQLQSAQPGPDGRVSREVKSYDVKIPAGVTSGQKIRLAGQGNPPMGRGRPGDLYLVVDIAPEPGFRLDGRDIYTDLVLTPWEAALGGEVNLKTINGQASLKIPPGSKSGRKLRLKGKGLPNRSGQGGNLIAVLQIATPKKLSEEERELFAKLAEVSQFKPRGE